MIRCLFCGRDFRFLPSHLHKAHDTTAAAYREAFDIPAGEPLADEVYRAAHRAKLTAMQADGRLAYDHLPEATEAARGAGRTAKRGNSREAHAAMLADRRPWEARQLPPGAKRADGRDADRARDYQREYRKKSKIRV